MDPGADRRQQVVETRKGAEMHEPEESCSAGPAGGAIIPDLTVRNFRGIREFRAEGLEQVNIVTGEPGSGKTSLIDALEIYASRASQKVLDRMLEQYNQHPDAGSLLHDDGNEVRTAAIGPEGKELRLTATGWADPGRKGIATHARGEDRRPLQYARLDPEPPDNHRMTALWDSVALSADEDDAAIMVKRTADRRVVRMGMLNLGETGRAPAVKLSDRTAPVPLRSLGRGAVMTALIALSMPQARGGLLLMDQADAAIGAR